MMVSSFSSLECVTLMQPSRAHCFTPAINLLASGGKSGEAGGRPLDLGRYSIQRLHKRWVAVFAVGINGSAFLCRKFLFPLLGVLYQLGSCASKAVARGGFVLAGWKFHVTSRQLEHVKLWRCDAMQCNAMPQCNAIILGWMFVMLRNGSLKTLTWHPAQGQISGTI